MLWRFIPLQDPEVEVALVRDADHVLTEIDRQQVEEFIAGDAKWHRYYDSEYVWPLIGGSFGAHRRDSTCILPGARKLIIDFANTHLSDPPGIHNRIPQKFRGDNTRDVENSSTAHGLFPYFSDQVFLREFVFEIAEKSLQTTNVTIRSAPQRNDNVLRFRDVFRDRHSMAKISNYTKQLERLIAKF
jgi:hypothetical protein